MSFDEKLKIIKIINETYDVKTFRLEKKNIDFVPGQYILVYLPFDDTKDEDRPFTFSSSPLKEYIEITVKKFGKITTIMHERLKVGEYLRLKGPFGESLNFDDSKDDIVFIAGGSGITPFKSIIDYIIDKKLKNKVFLFFSNRTEKDIIYREYLDKINKNNIKIINTLTNENWKGETGFINKELILKYIKNPKNYLYYICGPPGMVIAMKDMLKELGISESKLRIEDWQLPGKHDEE